jgi:hypothetical protein
MAAAPPAPERVRAAVLDALRACPEGLSPGQIYARLSGSDWFKGLDVAIAEVLNELLSRGEVWSCEVLRREWGTKPPLTVYFLPDPRELARSRAGGAP